MEKKGKRVFQFPREFGKYSQTQDFIGVYSITKPNLKIRIV